MKVGYLTILLAVGVTAVPLEIYTRPSDQYCLSDDDNPYLQFSTQTSYQIAKNRKPETQSNVPNCKPEAAWLLVRHGTRYPKPEAAAHLEGLRDTVTAIIENYEKRKHKELCQDDLHAFKQWRYRFHQNQLGQLAPEGRSDLKVLAGSYNLSLPELFSNPSPDKFSVRFTSAQRTRDSAQAFLEGLTPRGANIPWDLSDSNVDDLLMVGSGYSLDVNKNCTAWENSKDSPGAKSEKNAYAESAEMKDVIHRVSTRLGFQYDLQFDTILAMYDLCRSEKAVFYNEAVSTWCAAFTRKDLEVLEYYMDLSYYYSSGYGNPMTMQLGCPLVRDMLLKFDNITKSNGTWEGGNAVTLNFAHSVTLRSALTKLGIARDSTAPKHNNRPYVLERQWKTSRISPFTGNLAAVLYRCTTGEEWKLQFFLNQYSINYDGCDLGLCNWSYIMDRFKDHIDPESCNTDFCFKTNSAARLLPAALLAGVLVRLIL